MAFSKGLSLILILCTKISPGYVEGGEVHDNEPFFQTDLPQTFSHCINSRVVKIKLYLQFKGNRLKLSPNDLKSSFPSRNAILGR